MCKEMKNLIIKYDDTIWPYLLEMLDLGRRACGANQNMVMKIGKS